MRVNRVILVILPAAIMISAAFALIGIETWLAGLGKTEAAKLNLGRAGVAAPYVAAGALGVIFLFALAGSVSIRAASVGVTIGNAVVILMACVREGIRLAALSSQVPLEKSAFSYLDPSTMIGAAAALMSGCFALRVAMVGNAAFARAAPKRIIGKRALHGEADWMKLAEAEKLFSDKGGIVSTATVSPPFHSVPITARPGAPAANPRCSASTDRSVPRMASSSPDQAVSKRPL